MKKKAIQLIAVFLAAVLMLTAISAIAEDAGAFQIREGITFGMSKDEVIAQEIKNGVTQSAEEWDTMDLGGWLAMQAGNMVDYNGYNMYIMYMFANDQLIVAVYDSYVLDDAAAAFSDISGKLTTDFDEAAVLTPAAIAGFMDHFAEGLYKEEDLQDGNIWEKEEVTIRQFYYDTDRAFVVMFSDPGFDYASIAAQK